MPFFLPARFCDRTPILRSQPNPSLRPSCSIPEIYQKFLAKHGSASGAVSLECSCMPFRGRDYKGNCHILARTSPSRNCVCSRTDLSLTISGDYPGAVERARRLDPFVQVDPARDFRGFRGTPAGFPRYFVTGEFAVRQLALILGLISLSFQSSGVGLNWGRFEFYAPYIRALGARGTSHPLALNSTSRMCSADWRVLRLRRRKRGPLMPQLRRLAWAPDLDHAQFLHKPIFARHSRHRGSSQLS